MYGWNGRILSVDLSKGRISVQTFDLDFALKYIGGRGFAIRPHGMSSPRRGSARP